MPRARSIRTGTAQDPNSNEYEQVTFHVLFFLLLHRLPRKVFSISSIKLRSQPINLEDILAIRNLWEERLVESGDRLNFT